jgi:hypothetical protein
MPLRTHENNIPQIRAAVGHFGEVWVHGSGDIYQYNPNEPDVQDNSKNHMENFNRGFEENSFRVRINASNMPKSKAELDRLLMQAKNQDEILKSQSSVSKSRVTNIPVNDSHFSADYVEPAGDIDYSKYTKKQ